MIRMRNRFFAVGDVVLVAAAAYVSYVLRLERLDLGTYWSGAFLFACIAAVVTPVVLWRAGVYRRYWQYATAEDVLLLLGATTVAVILTSAISRLSDYLIPGETIVPRSIPLIFLLLALGVTTGVRMGLLLLARYAREPRTRVHMLRRRLMPSYQAPVAKGQPPAVPVLIMGAGAAGSMIVRELQLNPQLGMHVVGFLDDDPSKQKLFIHGAAVLGTRHDLPAIVQQHAVQTVIIAMPTASGKVIRDIVQMCEEIGVQTKTIPGMYELLGGKVSISQIRNVKVEDLLRRDPIKTDTSAVHQMLEGMTVLVTGAGGSIGSELCRQVLQRAPARLILLGHGENSIFSIDNELRRTQAQAHKDGATGWETEIIPVIADIRHPDRIKQIMYRFRPNVVFHAAAHKHVPLMEINPSEAITNNVTGTRVLLDAACACRVERFVLISTDKAVNPTSVMGASKRVAELLVHDAAVKTGEAYLAVRFGNVLGSRGSVVLTFEQQIAGGGPVTVTHPDMTRFFMTIPEAVQLVLQAATLGRGGEVFMLDMGDPIRIEDLARDLIELSGLRVGRDIDIVYTGARPGEKLTEELFLKAEQYDRTKHEKIFIAANASDLVPPDLSTAVSALQTLAEKNDTAALVTSLRRMLPNYKPQDLPDDPLASPMDSDARTWGDSKPQIIRSSAPAVPRRVKMGVHKESEGTKLPIPVLHSDDSGVSPH